MKLIAFILCLHSSISMAADPVYYSESKDWLLANIDRMPALKDKMASDPVVDTIFVMGSMSSFKGKNEAGFLEDVEPKNKEEFVSIIGSGDAFYSMLDGQFSISIGGQKECYGRHCDVEIIYSESQAPFEGCNIEAMKSQKTVCSVKLVENWHLRYLIYSETP